MSQKIFCTSRFHRRGQTIVETTMVFSAIIFFTFALMNLGMLIHTRNIATYAAFMSARSYQVFGDQNYNQRPYGQGQVRPHFEIGPDGKPKPLLDELKIPAAVRVAEDIYTCALPWMSVPAADRERQPKLPQPGKPFPPEERCMEGKRKYEKLNIGKNLDFLTFKGANSGASSGNMDTNLESVEGAYRERGVNPLTGQVEYRDPLRYGILQLRYRTPLLFNPLGIFGDFSGGETGSSGQPRKIFGIFEVNGNGEFVSDAVFVPVLLNPGLSTGLQDKQSQQNEVFDE